MTIASTGGTVTLGLYDTQSQLKEKASIIYVDNKEYTKNNNNI